MIVIIKSKSEPITGSSWPSFSDGKKEESIRKKEIEGERAWKRKKKKESEQKLMMSLCNLRVFLRDWNSMDDHHLVTFLSTIIFLSPSSSLFLFLSTFFFFFSLLLPTFFRHFGWFGDIKFPLILIFSTKICVSYNATNFDFQRIRTLFSLSFSLYGNYTLERIKQSREKKVTERVERERE